MANRVDEKHLNICCLDRLKSLMDSPEGAFEIIYTNAGRFR